MREIKRRGYSTVEQDFSEKTICIGQKKVNRLKAFDIEYQKKVELQNKIDLFCSVEIFESISIKNFRDLLQSAKQEIYEPGEFIIKEGTIGTKFYFVMKGVICIFNNSRT